MYSILENNQYEAFKNNILGTYNLMKILCGETYVVWEYLFQFQYEVGNNNTRKLFFENESNNTQ